MKTQMNFAKESYKLINIRERKLSIMALKFIYFEKAIKFCEISTVDLNVTTKNKSTVEILQKFVAFSECTNFSHYVCFVFIIHRMRFIPPFQTRTEVIKKFTR